MEFYLFLIFAFFAEIVGTFTGFGTTTILVPLASFFMSLPEAIVLAGLFHLFGTIFRSAFFIKGINLKITLIFGVPALIFSYLGASFLPIIDVKLLSKLLGIALILYASYSLLSETRTRSFEHQVRLPKNPLILAGGGSLVGFLAGLIGTAGALRGAFLTSWGLSKSVYLGTGAAMGLGADLTRVLSYYQSGLLKSDFNLPVTLAIVALVGTFLGYKAVKFIQQKLFQKIILIALILAGVKFLIS